MILKFFLIYNIQRNIIYRMLSANRLNKILKSKNVDASSDLSARKKNLEAEINVNL